MITVKLPELIRMRLHFAALQVTWSISLSRIKYRK